MAKTVYKNSVNKREKTKQTKPNVWDSSIPVEKSAYVYDEDDITISNVENFHHDATKLTMIDLFCGAGGFSVGASLSGFESVFGNDYLRPAMDTWAFNHPNALYCLGNVKKIDPLSVKRVLAEKGVTHINLLTGGVPCQGFSISNRKHNDFDERNFLFLDYMRFVKVFEPDYLILENVSGLRSTAEGKFEKDIKAAMEELDYKVTIKLVNAADYGVPQIRLRLLFVGVKKHRNLNEKYEFPSPEYGNKQGLKPYRTVADAISDLPFLENSEEKTEYECEPCCEFQGIMRGYNPQYGIGKVETLFNHQAPSHPQRTIDKIALTSPGAAMYPRFKQRIRLSLDKPSPTQLAGGIRPQFQFGHPTQPRGLTIRERARIQSFPDCYVFKGGIVQERVQTGNAVPPLLIYAITKPIAEDLLKEKKNV